MTARAPTNNASITSEFNSPVRTSSNVPPIAENEYDNIYIVSIPWFGKTKTIRLRFGEPYTGDPVDESFPGVTMTQ